MQRLFLKDIVYKTTQVTTQVQHDTTRDNASATRVKLETALDNTSTIQGNTSTTSPNTSTKESLAAKIGLHIALFVTKLYIFLISFRNSLYSPPCNSASTLWTSRAYNTSFRNVKQSRTYHALREIKRFTEYELKIAIQVQKIIAH